MAGAGEMYVVHASSYTHAHQVDEHMESCLLYTSTLYCSDEMYDFLNAIPMDELADLMIVSHVDLVKGCLLYTSRCV